MPNGPEPAPAAAVSLPALTDFPDRLPPVLVKELRQGLRGRMFVIPFLVLQLLLMLTNVEPGRGATLSFWHFILIVLVFLLPSRSLGALGEERDANTLDTLVLTRLTPWRIVWGKWCAVTAQSVITAVAVIPYLLVRYLNGGANVGEDAIVLLVLLLLSGAVAGVFTALSMIKSPLLRNGLAGAVIVVVYAGICRPLIFEAALGWGMVPPAELAGIAVLAVWAALFSLWHAAAGIAPAAANVTTPRRLTSMVAVLVLSEIAAVSMPGPNRIIVYGLLGMLGMISVVEMGEPLNRHPGLAAAFHRRGPFGRMAGLLFRPGWDTGVLFCVWMWILAGIVSAMALEPGLATAGLCFFPVTARLVFPRRMRMGAAPLVVLAIASHGVRQLFLSVDSNPDSIGALIPGLYDWRMSMDSLYPLLSAGWICLALLQAIISLVSRARRREGHDNGNVKA